MNKELDVLTRTLWGEARGEPTKGVIAVAWTIKNRANKPCWWGNSIESVCLKKYQFSCWNSNDPNYPFLSGKKPIPTKDYVRLQESAVAVIDGHELDPTYGATHYYAKSMRNPPVWTKGAKMTTVIGNHIFYKDVP